MPDEVLAIVGSSGAGKSSLLHCLAGLLAPTSGSIHLGNAEITKLDGEARATLRRREFGFVFQFADLVPELTLQDNVALPLILNGMSGRVAGSAAAESMKELGLGDLLGRRPSQVSGGEAQRAAVARALIHNPSVVFADEPTGALDQRNGQHVLQLLLERARDQQCSVVVVTHDMDVATRADRVITMRDGRVVDVAPSMPTLA
jgi:putative ABC transport system ATP-binding protein